MAAVIFGASGHQVHFALDPSVDVTRGGDSPSCGPSYILYAKPRSVG